MTKFNKPKGSKVPKTEKFQAIKAMEEILVKFGNSYTDEHGHVVLKEGWSFARLLVDLQQKAGGTYDGYASAGGLYNLCVEYFGTPRPQGFLRKQNQEQEKYAEYEVRVDSTKRLDSLSASMVSFDKRLHAYDEVNKALEESSRQLAGQVMYLRKMLTEETSQRRAVQQKLNDFLVEWGKEIVPLEEPGPRLVTTKAG